MTRTLTRRPGPNSFARELWRIVRDADITTSSAAVAYYAILTVVPLSFVALAIASFFLGGRESQQVARQVVQLLHLDAPTTQSAIEQQVRQLAGPAGGLGLLGLVPAAWSGSALFGAFRRALARMFGAPPVRMVHGRLRDLALVAGLALLVLASLAASGLPAYLGAVSIAAYLATVIPPLLLNWVAVLGLYLWVPGPGPRPRTAAIAAAVAAVTLELVKQGLAFYFVHISSLNRVYGSLGAVIGSLLLAYLSTLIVLLCAGVARALELTVMPPPVVDSDA